MEFIDQFESHYGYDCDYMRKIERSAPKAFETFVNFLPMGQVGSSLPKSILWTAKISAMLTEDCGACVQLNITMAKESGVDSALLKNITANSDLLDPDHKLIFDFAKSVAANCDDHHQLQNLVEKKYSPEQVSELALAIASTKVYPTIKRALGDFKSCSLYQFDF